jgi:hypothetical protein
MSGEPGTYTAGTPEDVKGLRKKLIDLISSGMNTGNTSYSGPMGTVADQGQVTAMNMLMGLTGNGKYSLPSTYSMQNQPSMGSGSSRVIPTPSPSPSPSPSPTPTPTPTPTPNPRDRTNPVPTPTPTPSPYPGMGPGHQRGGSAQTGDMSAQTLFQLISAMRGM